MTLREFISFKKAYEIDMSRIENLCVSLDPVHVHDFDNSNLGLRLDWEIKSIAPDPDDPETINVEVEPPGYNPYRDALNSIYEMFDNFFDEGDNDVSELLYVISEAHELAGTTLRRTL